MPNLVADGCVHKPICFLPCGGGWVSQCRHYLAVENGNSLQQLKAEIRALLVPARPCCKNGIDWVEIDTDIFNKLRELSAI